jgi:GT2 family glycosyltransferase
MAASVFDQSHGEVELLLTGSERPAREWAARLAVGNHQIRLADIGARIADVIGQARHEMIVLTAPGARLHRHALAWFSWALGSQAAAAHVCDAEQVSGAGADVRFAHPALRQAVDHEILLQANPYAGSIAFDRRRCAAQISGIDAENSARFAFALLLELAFERSVGHIPYPLAAGPDDETQTPFGGLDAHLYARLVQAHLQRRGLADQVDCAHPEAGEPVALKVRWRARNPNARLHLVIPTRDNGEDVRALVASLRATRARSGDTRITIVDNGSVDPATRRILSQVSGPDLEVWRCDEVFNWSRLSNLGAARQAAEIVVFVNDDMVMLTPGWDDLLRGLLDRPDVGVVGGKLLYPDQTIQHAGILFGWKGRAIHDGLYEARDAPGPGGRWQLRRRVAAVTGAFLAMRKPLFDELGGFDAQRLAVGYSDLDMALKARRRGLAVLYAPEIELTHYESKSRGLTHLDPTAAALDEAELAVLRARWPGELDADVCVHPAWLDATLPFRLLRAPDAAAVRRHIVATSCDDPWRPSASRAEIERLLAENPLD